MAVSTDPLRRDAIGVVAQLPTGRLQAPATNSALQLAEALRDATPEARATLQGVAEDRAQKARAQAKKDALEASGALLSDAVRAGKIKATQNPWYVQAYNREAAAVRAQDALQNLQVQSAEWEEQTDAAAFAKKWREEVGAISEEFDGEDFSAGFIAAEAATTSQVLQTNVARNVGRIQTERTQNLGSLAVDALQTSLRTKGGALSPNEAFEALLPARQQWFATGGDTAGWNQIVTTAVTTTAYGARDKFLLDLLKAPELLQGPSEVGGLERIGSGQGFSGGVTSVETIAPVEPPQPGAEPLAPVTVARVEAPSRKGLALALPVDGGHLTSGFGNRRAPKKGASTFHKGIDLALPEGSPVKAQGVGKVVFAAEKGANGNLVQVDYGNGVIASYAHLSAFNVKEGDLVGPGQAIAAVGSTGNSTGPHLHYSLKVNGESVDPTTFKGQVGGTFEATQAEDVPTPESLVGFPGQDQPFTAGPSATPPNQFGRGVSIYSLPGVADQVESDRFRIGEAQQAAITESMRAIDAQRTARAYAGQDYLLNKYGTGVLVGTVTRETIISDLSGQGYSAPEIAKTLNFIREGLTDSVGVANAQVEARQQVPGVAKAVLDLRVRAATTGYTEGLEDEVGALVLQRVLSGDDAAGIVGGALTRSRNAQAEDRAEAREARVEAKLDAQGTVNSYSDLREQADILAGFVVTKAVQVNPFKEAALRDPQVRARLERAIADAMGSHLAVNPRDFEGAQTAGRAAAATLLRNQTTSAIPPATTSQGSSSGSNPRRTGN